jgi:DNA-binding transcriptional MerR regulator
MSDDVRWTLDELCEQVSKCLAKESREPLDGRVREVPDQRTLRYYTTLGLIDRPAEMRGRTAYYGSKHLWQILAIKRLQARGLSLTEIQQALLGLDEPALQRLAGVKEETRSRKRKSEREAFWSAAPAPVEPKATSPANAKIMQGVPLGEGVVLLIEARRDVREEDRMAIRRVTESLLEILRTRGLIDEKEDSP